MKLVCTNESKTWSLQSSSPPQHCSIVKQRASADDCDEQPTPLNFAGCFLWDPANLFYVYHIIPMFSHARQVASPNNGHNSAVPAQGSSC